jgi:hypothetical protein
MDRQEARSILSLHRSDEPANDERHAQAKELAAKDPELARWWIEDQEIDDAIAKQLAAIPLPGDLKARVMSRASPLSTLQPRWQRPILAAAAAIVALAVVFGFWRGSLTSTSSLAGYRHEMVLLINNWQPLDLETTNLAQIDDFLRKSGGPSSFEIPKPLRNLTPIGCRVFRSHGKDVALICFKPGGGHVMHLFVTRTDGISMKGLQTTPKFAQDSGWMTAMWKGDGQVYLVVLKGDRAAAEKLLSST